MRFGTLLGACLVAAPSLAQSDTLTTRPFGVGRLRQPFTRTPLDPSTKLPEPTPNPQTTSTPASTRTTKRYIIFPKGGADTDTFQATLEALIAPQVPKMTDMIKDPTGDVSIKTVLMWTALLTPAQLEQVKANSAVDATIVDEPLPNMVDDEEGVTNAPKFLGTSKRQTGHKLRQLVSDHKLGRNPSIKNVEKLPRSGDYDLAYLSTPPGASPDDTYEVDSSGGEGITVYIVDHSFELDHFEFSGDEREIRRIDVSDNDLEEDTALETETSLPPPQATGPSDHGTCSASKAVGRTAGAAPNANLVAVAIPSVPDSFYISMIMRTFSMISNDIIANKLRGKAVLSFSHGWTKDMLPEDAENKLIKQLWSIIKLDVPIVCAAGNVPSDISLFPQSFANQLPIINVGMSDWTGRISAWSSKGPLLTTTAGGIDVVCGSLGGGYILKSGSSYSAPLVAGMVAYWLGHPDYNEHFPKGYVAMAAKSSILNLHYVRKYGPADMSDDGSTFYPMAYNGVHNCYDEADDHFEFWPGEFSLEDRQDPGQQPPMMGLIRPEACRVRPVATPTTTAPAATSAA